jgi:hypothetical protein
VAPYPAPADPPPNRSRSDRATGDGSGTAAANEDLAPNWAARNPAAVLLLLAGGFGLAIMLFALLLVLLRWL